MRIMSYKNLYILTDGRIVEEIGQNIKTLRLEANYSQQELADRAGLDRVTISKLENGRPATMLTIVQVLRAMQRLDILSHFFVEPQISPLMLAEAQEKIRYRASAKNKTPKNTDSEW
jgi:putative transcriptional regulator